MAGFELYLASLGLADRTIKKTLDRMSYLEKNVAFDSESIASFVLSKKRDFSEACANKFIQTLTHYKRWSKLDFEIPKYFREHNKIRETFSDQEIEQILSIKNNYTPFFGLLAYSGARPGEIMNLQPEDVDLTLNVLKLRVTKTSEDRVVPIAESAKDFVKALPFNFCDQAARHELKRRCVKLGIRYRPIYSFRHSLISRLIDSDVPLFQVMALAGHKQADTTLHYYHTSLTHLRQAIERDTLNLSKMPADKKLELLKKHLREMIERLHLQDDFDVEVNEKETQVKLVVKKKTSD